MTTFWIRFAISEEFFSFNTSSHVSCCIYWPIFLVFSASILLVFVTTSFLESFISQSSLGLLTTTYWSDGFPPPGRPDGIPVETLWRISDSPYMDHFLNRHVNILGFMCWLVIVHVKVGGYVEEMLDVKIVFVATHQEETILFSLKISAFCWE